jgi:putative oxidoreductase
MSEEGRRAALGGATTPDQERRAAPRETQEDRSLTTHRFDWRLNILNDWSGPMALAARLAMAYVFVVEGVGKIANPADVAAYMEANGVSAKLLPLVILVELGGGLLVAAGLAARAAAIALAGFCVLTALLFHMGGDQTIEFQKNLAIAGGFLVLAAFGPGGWSLDAWLRIGWARPGRAEPRTDARA